MKLSERILTLRKQHNFSQEQLASKMGVTRQTISRWESELSTPDYSNIEKLSEIFGMSVNEFLNIEDQKEVYQEMIDQITDTQNQQYKKITNYFKYFGIIITIGFGLVGFGMYKLWNKPAQVIITPSYQETTEEHDIIDDFQLEIVEQQASYILCTGFVRLNEYTEGTEVAIKVKYGEHADVYYSESWYNNYYSDNGNYTFDTIYIPSYQDFSYCIVVINDGISKEYRNVSLTSIKNTLFYNIDINSYSPLSLSLETNESTIPFKVLPKSIDFYVVNKDKEVVLSGKYSTKKEDYGLSCVTDLAMIENLLKEEGELTLYIRINGSIDLYYASESYTSKTGFNNSVIDRIITKSQFKQITS